MKVVFVDKLQFCSRGVWMWYLKLLLIRLVCCGSWKASVSVYPLSMAWAESDCPIAQGHLKPNWNWSESFFDWGLDFVDGFFRDLLILRKQRVWLDGFCGAFFGTKEPTKFSSRNSCLSKAPLDASRVLIMGSPVVTCFRTVRQST